MIALAYGGGTDSTAILCGWVERGYHAIDPIDVILFADTGAERPETYAYIELMQLWLEMHGMPPITIVKKGGLNETLEQYALRTKMLPSLAYGRKGCSQKFKVEPQEKYLNNYGPTKAWWKAGARKEVVPGEFTPTGKPKTRTVYDRKVTKLIGYEAAEEHRWMKAKQEDEKYFYEFPLVMWGWSRPDCQAAILRAGLPLPGKSSCFFCPAHTKPEIDAMQKTHPILLHRALRLEANAAPNLKSSKGLGRRFAWADYIAGKQVDDSDQAGRCMVCIDN